MNFLHERTRYEDLIQLKKKSLKRGYNYEFSQTGGSHKLYTIVEKEKPEYAGWPPGYLSRLGWY